VPSRDASLQKASKEKNDDDGHGHGDDSNTVLEQSTGTTSGQLLSKFLWLSRILSCLLFLYGFYLGQSQLCTHEECDMTYSMRMFLELDLDVPTSTRRTVPREQPQRPPKYRLYKFIDQRDPRHKPFQKRPQPLQGNDWCFDASQTTAVLYIPGHGEF
jgi:hypothetical protein